MLGIIVKELIDPGENFYISVLYKSRLQQTQYNTKGEYRILTKEGYKIFDSLDLLKNFIKNEIKLLNIDRQETLTNIINISEKLEKRGYFNY